ncbi:hypothetical protein FB03_02230 [Actinotignum schaalii]|nr:hypothetical protein FB03_02230 [Actinotignum schaalii]
MRRRWIEHNTVRDVDNLFGEVSVIKRKVLVETSGTIVNNTYNLNRNDEEFIVLGIIHLNLKLASIITFECREKNSYVFLTIGENDAILGIWMIPVICLKNIYLLSFLWMDDAGHLLFLFLGVAGAMGASVLDSRYRCPTRRIWRINHGVGRDVNNLFRKIPVVERKVLVETSGTIVQDLLDFDINNEELIVLGVIHLYPELSGIVAFVGCIENTDIFFTI